MKGFKKDGKFVPTGNKKKSSLKKSDIKPRKRNDAFNGIIGSGTPDPNGQHTSTYGNTNTRNPTNTSKSKPVQPQSPPPQPIGSASSFTQSNANKNGALPKDSLKMRGLKGLVGLGKSGVKKGISSAQQTHQKSQQAKHDQEQIQDIINQSIDQILDDRKSSNEQKFRMLQRYAHDNKEALTDYQVQFVNNTLKILNDEQLNPQTFLSEVQAGTKGTIGKSNQKSTQQSGQQSRGTQQSGQTQQSYSPTARLSGYNPTNTQQQSTQQQSTQQQSTQQQNTDDADNQGAELSAILGG